jgi:tetratricopeptide (TPR) repeat protein
MPFQASRFTAGLIAAAFFVALSTNAIGYAETRVMVPSGETPTNQDGERLLHIGDYVRAEQSFRTALANAAKNSAAEMYAHLGLGEALLWQGQIADAGKEFKRAESLERKASAGPSLSSRLQDDYSWFYQAKDDLPKALEAAKSALAQRQAEGPAASFATTFSLIHTAYIADLMGQLSDAVTYYKQAIASIPPGQDDLLQADTQQRLASVLWRLGNTEQATQLYNQGLATELKTNAPLQKYTPHPYWDNVIHRYQAGAPNNSRRTIGGQDQEIIWANGVAVAASFPQMMPADKAVQIQVAIKNDSQDSAQFLPQPPQLVITKPKAGLAQLVDPQSLANTVEQKGERKAKWIRFWGADATMPITTTYMNQPGYYGWGYNNFPPVSTYGYGPRPIVNYGGGMTTVTTQVPDYAAQQRALERAADAIDQSKSTAEAIRTQSLGPTTVQPGAVVKGSLYFDAKSVTQSVLRIPVGNAIFEFEFPPR